MLYKLNTAQEFLLDLMEDGNSLRDYKAPHAYRPTPPRQRKFTRVERFTVQAADEATGQPARIRKPRLFKGHRA